MRKVCIFDLCGIGMTKSGCSLTVLCAFAALSAVLLPVFAGATANFVHPGRFLIQKHCKAYTSFKNQTGEVDLQVGQEYTAFAENKRVGSSHTHLDIEGQRKWATLDCGEYVGGKPSFKEQGGGNGGLSGTEEECPPFFDNVDNPVEVGFGGLADITPEAPLLDPLGEAVNTMCGAPGKKTSRHEFKQMIKNQPGLIAELMEFTGGKVFHDLPQRHDEVSYLNDLTEAWYAVHAFDHIFCGEPGAGGSVGGLHYYGRYKQLQDNEEACRIDKTAKNEVDPGVIYTVGVKMKRPNGKWAKSEIKGYGLTLSARDILKVATRAFVENPTSSSSSTGCILDLNDTGIHFKTVFVRRAKGIRTFYPDATPDLNRNPACSAPVVLSGDRINPICTDTDNANVLSAGPFRISIKGHDQNGVDLRLDKCD